MKALILQGWQQKTTANWYPWLEGELKKLGYEVYLPDLPTMHTDLPDMNEQLNFIENLLAIDEETIIIGHSLGCLLAMRLAEKHKYKKMFLVAGWDFDDLFENHQLFWPNKIDHEKIKENVKEIYCLSSDNDPYFTAFTVEQMSKRLNGKFILVKGAGHFIDEFNITTLPEILKYI
ncbi:MAG: alpha/beta fold hydrolase [Candidatus Roizmanbacteria bacterium]|nr:MAG: alpha/beta fold hydrolase [Candidatus Roizmanbacteria bacterium]